MSWKDYFFFTASERRGICALLALIVVLCCVKAVTASQTASLSTSVPIALDSLETSNNQIDSPLVTTPVAVVYIKPRKPDSTFSSHRRAKSLQIIELNTADTLALQALPGIGPVLSRRIVKFRERLGGFYHPRQLEEVYGIQPATIERVLPRLRADTAAIVRLDVNRLSVAELKRHPYLNYYQAVTIVKCRQKSKQGILSLRELEGERDFSADDLRLLRYYLKFEPLTNE